jgi:hypothetical protein
MPPLPFAVAVRRCRSPLPFAVAVLLTRLSYLRRLMAAPDDPSGRAIAPPDRAS